MTDTAYTDLSAHLRTLASSPFARAVKGLGFPVTRGLVEAAGQEETREAMLRFAEQLALKVVLERTTLVHATEEFSAALGRWASGLEVAAEPAAE